MYTAETISHEPRAAIFLHWASSLSHATLEILHILPRSWL